jgi:hypothetical protein
LTRPGYDSTAQQSTAKAKQGHDTHRQRSYQYLFYSIGTWTLPDGAVGFTTHRRTQALSQSIEAVNGQPGNCM